MDEPKKSEFTCTAVSQMALTSAQHSGCHSFSRHYRDKELHGPRGQNFLLPPAQTWGSVLNWWTCFDSKSLTNIEGVRLWIREVPLDQVGWSYCLIKSYMKSLTSLPPQAVRPECWDPHSILLREHIQMSLFSLSGPLCWFEPFVRLTSSNDDNIISFPCIFALIITTHLWRREMSWISSCSETYFAQILQIVSSFGCPLRALHAQKFDENGQKTTECKQ